MQAKAFKKRFGRSGCPLTHFSYKHGLGDFCDFHFSNRFTGADMLFGSTGAAFSRDSHYASHGHRRPGWDI